MDEPLPPTRDPAAVVPVTPAAPAAPVTPVTTVTPVQAAPAAAVTPVYRTAVPAYVRVIQLIWFVTGVVDVLVGLRFLLKLFGASTASGFVALLYGLTAALVGPFQNIFPVTGTRTFIFEPASLVALAIYPLIALGVTSLIRILSRRRTLAA